jgi:transposase
MSAKRRSIQKHIDTDLRHQHAVLRRYGRREHHRVTPLLHRTANELLSQSGSRFLVFEDLTHATETILRRSLHHRTRETRRRVSAWTHGRLAEIVSYKARTPILWVNPEGDLP